MKAWPWPGLVIVFVGGLLVLIAYIVADLHDSKREAEVAELRPPSKAETIMRGIRYVGDKRTKLCFAYIGDVNTLQGQFSFTNVPCASIPPELIEVGK